MNPKMQHARSIYYMTEFRQFMRNMQGLTDEQFSRPVPKIVQKILSATEQDPMEKFD